MRGTVKLIFGIWIALLLCGFLLAAPSEAAANNGRYTVVAGGEDKAYLVDTVTGAVWILTHRTLPTGREPVAIPYKFIKISPNQQEFLIEKAPDTTPGDGEK